LPYCRRCGAKLEDNARFCQKCGVQTITFAPRASSSKPTHKPLLSTNEIVLIAVAIAVVVVVAAIFFVIILSSFNTNQANSSYPTLSTFSYVIREVKMQTNGSSLDQLGKVSFKVTSFETIITPLGTLSK